MTGSEKETVLTFSEAATDNLLAGLNANDYTQFSRDFDNDLQRELPPNAFAALNLELESELGNYRSRTVTQVTKADEFYVVTYQVTFEHEEAIAMSVAFHDSDQSIATVSIESENVSWSAYQRR